MYRKTKFLATHLLADICATLASSIYSLFMSMWVHTENYGPVAVIHRHEGFLSKRSISFHIKRTVYSNYLNTSINLPLYLFLLVTLMGVIQAAFNYKFLAL